MLSLVALSCLIGVAMSQGFGVPAPAPVQPGYGQVVIPPNYGPGYGYPHYYPDDYSDSRSSSSEEKKKKCQTCRKLKTSCKNYEGAGKCKRAHVTSIKRKGCKWGVVSCGSKPSKMMTEEDDILSQGSNIDKMIYCKGKKWAARDITGEKVKFKHVFCVDEPEEKPKKPADENGDGSGATSGATKKPADRNGDGSGAKSGATKKPADVNGDGTDVEEGSGETSEDK